MRIFLPFMLGASLCAFSYARFAYERGSCETSIFSVVQDMLKSELRALVDPTTRYSNKKRLQFDLYTRRNPYKRQILKFGNVEALRNSNFNPQWPVRFSIHGWAGKSTTCSNAIIKDAYLARGNFNVILVDWSEYALDISYARLSKQLSAIAASLVKFINFLKRETDIDYAQIYLIGHSAGSHISGLAGKILKPQLLGAIYALDPAGLTQLGLSADFRLAPDDALYVESIHTDVALLGNPSTELSQAAFFPNWGQGQPQCPNVTAAEFDFACDHFAALYYFAESIRHPKQFGAVQCPNSHNIEQFNCRCTQAKMAGDDDRVDNSCAAMAFMGGEPASPKTGIYYLSTNSRPPYGAGNVVRIRPPISPNYLKSSFVSQRIVDKIRSYN